nr:unnamed protein product [Callosobruchus analis]
MVAWSPYLLEDQSNWPNPTFTLVNNIPEMRTTLRIVAIPIDCDIFSLYSSLTTMQRVVAYLFRFAHNAKHQNDKRVGHLSVSELEFALSILIKIAQRQCYLKDIQALQLSKSLHAKSKLLPLNPFLDKNDVLRVGDRLQHNNQLKYEQRHHIILPANHTLTNIARDIHIHLTADNFIASLRRFISRRGKPRCIYSDNGSNFVGAHRKQRNSPIFSKSRRNSDVLDIPTNRLDHYQLQQSIMQHFWKRWQREYIPELQGRVKWKLNKASLATPGSLVVLQEDGPPPFKWPLGRIEQLCYGADSIPRVALVKCNGGIIKRPLSKLCILPSAIE